MKLTITKALTVLGLAGVLAAGAAAGSTWGAAAPAAHSAAGQVDPYTHYYD